MERRLDEGGWEAATSTAVAAEAGVSVGTFYSYFSDRDDALAALFARRLVELLRAVQETLSTDALLDDGLEAVLERTVAIVLDAFRGHAATYRAALVQLPSSPAIRTVYWEAHRETEMVLTTFIRRAQEAGKVRDAEPVVLARTLLIVVQGANNPLLTAPAPDAASRTIVGEIVEMLNHLLTR